MQFDQEYPVNWQKVYKHRKANLIGKKRLEVYDEDGIDIFYHCYDKCSCCNREVGYLPKFHFDVNLQDRFSIYGPNIVLYFGLTKRIIIFLFVCLLFFGISAIMLNLTGNACSQNNNQCSETPNITYYWSINNIANDQNRILGQLIIQIITCIFITVFNLYLRLYSSKLYNEIDEKNRTQSDYSIILRSIDRSLPDQKVRQEIKTLIQEDVKKQIEDDEQKIKVSENMQIEEIIPIPETESYFKTTKENLQELKKYISDEKKVFQPTKTLEDFHRQIKEKIRNQFCPKPLPQLDQFSGSAIVVFTSAYSNNFLDYRPSLKNQIVSYFFPFFKPQGKYKINNIPINVEPAPEPSNIVWTHFGYTEENRICRKILYSALSLIVLSASSAINYGLQKIRLEIVNAKEDPFWFEMLETFILFCFNPVIEKILYSSTRKQKLDNYTDENIELMFKISFYQTLNAGFFVLLMPFLAEFPNYQRSLKNNPINESVLLILIFQIVGCIFINIVVKILELDKKILMYLVKKQFIILTQSEANKAFEGRKMNIADNFVFNLRITLYSLVFAIISPICILLGAICLLIQYHFERYLANQNYSIPEYGGKRLNSQFIDLFDVTPLLIGVFNFVVILATVNFDYEKMNQTHLELLFICIGIGLFNFMMPWNNILENLLDGLQTQIDARYNEAKMEFQITYEKMIPSKIEKLLDDQIKLQSRWIKKHSSIGKQTARLLFSDQVKKQR